MWMLSVAMAMRNTGAIELMMCTGKPAPISSPMLQMIAVMATAIMARDSDRLRNMIWMAMNMIMPAMGEKMPIRLNISAPEGARAPGDVVAFRSAFPGDDGADPAGDLGAVGALLQRHVDGGRLAVRRDDAI